MISRRDVLKAPNVRGPAPLAGIERARQDELVLRQASRRLQEQSIKLFLTISGVGAHITEEALECPAPRHGRMDFGIDAAIERPRSSRIPLGLQIGQNRAAGKGKIESEFRYLLAAQVLHVAALERC